MPPKRPPSEPRQLCCTESRPASLKRTMCPSSPEAARGWLLVRVHSRVVVVTKVMRALSLLPVTRGLTSRGRCYSRRVFYERTRTKLVGFATASMLAAAAFLTSGGAVAAASSYTCTGGSIPAGTYSTVLVQGSTACTVDAGNVSVTHSLVVGQSAVLNSAFASSNLTVLGIRCTAPSGPGPRLRAWQLPSKASTTRRGRTMTCRRQPDRGSRSGGDCPPRGRRAQHLPDLWRRGGPELQPTGCPWGNPAYSTYEDVTVGGSVTIFGLRTCWLGVIRTHVHGSVVFVNNVNGDPDGNEIVTNVIRGDLGSVTATRPSPRSETRRAHRIGSAAGNWASAPTSPGS